MSENETFTTQWSSEVSGQHRLHAQWDASIDAVIINATSAGHTVQFSLDTLETLRLAALLSQWAARAYTLEEQLGEAEPDDAPEAPARDPLKPFCHYCGSEEHYYQECPRYAQDQREHEEACQRDATVDKSDWPL